MSLALLAAPGEAEPVATRPEVLGPTRIEPALNERVSTLPVTVRTADGRRHTVATMVTTFQPSGTGPFPLVVFSHGRDADPRSVSRSRNLALAGYFVRRGFAVLIPTRIGHGGFARIDPEQSNQYCTDGSAQQQIDAVRAHIDAALVFARSQPWADPRRMLLAGQSVGGYTSIAAAAQGVPGVIGVINFAGGAGARMRGPRGQPLCPERIERVMRRAGPTLRVPTLWVYGRNDRYWGTQWPERWHAAFRSAGGMGDLVWVDQAPAEGHGAVGQVDLWRRPADAFLASFGIRPPMTADAPAPSDFAALDDVAKLPSVAQPTRDAYARFLRADVPRAFVIGPGAGWAYRSGQPTVLRDALAACAQVAKAACRPYAVDDAVVWTP